MSIQANIQIGFADWGSLDRIAISCMNGGQCSHDGGMVGLKNRLSSLLSTVSYQLQP